MTRFRTLFLLVAALAITISGAATAAGQTKTIKIGWVGPLSPPGAYASGRVMKWAVQLAVDEVNKAGGALGRPIRVVYEDTKGTPDQGTAAMERLIHDDHVAAVIGEFHSSVALAEIAVAHKYGVPWIGSDVWADSITAKQYPEVFRVSPANSQIYTTVGDWVVRAGFKNVAIMQETTAYGAGAVRVLKGIFEKNGIRSSVVTVRLDQKDFTPELHQLMSRKPRPDLVMMLVATDAIYPAIQEACDQGFAPTPETALYSGSGVALEKEIWQATGKCARYLITGNMTIPKAEWNKQATDFAAAYEKRFHRPPTPTAMRSFDSLKIVVQAIRNAGTTDPKAIIQALENIRYTGTLGEYSFSNRKSPAWAYHQSMEEPVMVVQYDKQNQTPDMAPILYPRKWATIKPLYLKPGK